MNAFNRFIPYWMAPSFLMLALFLPLTTAAQEDGNNFFWLNLLPPGFWLDSWSFDNSNCDSDFGFAPLSATNITQVPDWDGQALQIDSTNAAWLAYNVFENAPGYGEYTNLTVDTGTIEFWFSPDWQSADTNFYGSGPGAFGRLIEVGMWTQNAASDWWSLYLNPSGTSIHFSSGIIGVRTNYVTAPISWGENSWHMVALTFGPTNTAIYIDGQLAATGDGIRYVPSCDTLANGFMIGSDFATGIEQARGEFDDLTTYNYQLNAGDVANDYATMYLDLPGSPNSGGTFHAMDDEPPIPGDGDGSGGGDGGGFYAPNAGYGTNLYIQATNASSGQALGSIVNSSIYVPYTIFSKQSLLWPIWTPEATYYGSWVTNLTGFSISMLGRSNLFLQARSEIAPRIVGAASSGFAVVRRDKTVWTWGTGTSGQLGNGQSTNSATPVQVVGLSNIVAVAVPTFGNYTMALDAYGEVWTWGANNDGQLGRDDGMYLTENTPSIVVGLSNVVAVAGGEGHAIALKSDGTVWAWGDNEYGDLGDSSEMGRDYAAPVPALTNVIAIASGDFHCFAICSTGEVWGWGFNEYEQLGIGNDDDESVPCMVSGLTNAVALSGGYSHSIALLSNGTVEAWGANLDGEIGNIHSSVPVSVPGLSNIVSIASGGFHNLFIDTNGGLFAWGNDRYSQFGDDAEERGSTTPYLISTLTNVTSIAGGYLTSIVSRGNGDIYTFGNTETTPTLTDLYTNYSSDGSGLPDWWEMMYFHHLGLNPNSDPLGDGLTLLQDYEENISPTNYPAVTGLTETNGPDGVILTWNAASPTPLDYGIYRIDYNYDTWQFGSPQEIGEVSGTTTTFTDNGSISGGGPISIYEVEGLYSGGSIPPPAAENPQNMPEYTVPAQIVRGPGGSLYLVVGAIPQDVIAFRVYRTDTQDALYPISSASFSVIPYGTHTNSVYTWEPTQLYTPGVGNGYFDVPVTNLVNGVYELSSSEAPPFGTFTFQVQALSSNGIAGEIITDGYATGDTNRADYNIPFYDGRTQIAQNINFLLRTAQSTIPFTLNAITAGFSWFYPGNDDYVFAGFHFYSGGLVLNEFQPFEENNYYENYCFASDNVDTNGTLDTGVGSFTAVGRTENLYYTDYSDEPPTAYNFNTYDFVTGSSVSMAPVLSSDVAQWIYFAPGSQSIAYAFNTNYFIPQVDNYYGLPLVSVKWPGYSMPPTFPTLTPGSSGADVSGDWFFQYDQPTLTSNSYYFARHHIDPLPSEDDFSVTDTTPSVIFASVGQPFNITAWAKESLANGYSGKFAYAEQYFDAAYLADDNGNITTNQTGILSEYGEFFPTEPGTVFLRTKPDGALGSVGQCAINVIGLAVDADHDGTIDPTFSGPDFTSPGKPYVFWLNNNYDRTNWDEDDQMFYDEDVESNSPSAASPFTGQSAPDSEYRDPYGNRMIPTARDLEDFARLWVCGLTSNLVATLPADSTVTLNWGDVGNPNPNNPTIDIFTAGDADGGIEYMTNQQSAYEQVDPIYSPFIGRLAPGGSIQLNGSRFNRWAGNHFIWCGVTNGTGALTLTITDPNGNILARASAYIQLEDIKQMYERWTVGDDPNETPATYAQLATDSLPQGASSPFRYTNPGNANTPYILFVHGWNCSPFDKDWFAQTAFKRLYWQGYHGRFGLFRWPTYYGFLGTYTQLFTNMVEKDNYDDGEYQAWQSAPGLLYKLEDLNSQYPGKVYVIAHSMGNVVIGEALRLAGSNQVVNTYIATQAAISAHTYDPTIPDYSFFYLPWSDEPTTPNIYNGWFEGNYGYGAGRVINLYNTNDFALSRGHWQLNQLFKPDQDVSENGISWDYGYDGNANDPPPWTNFFKQEEAATNGTIVNFDIVGDLNNRYEVMAFDAQSYTTAFGATQGIHNIAASADLTTIWPSPDPLFGDYGAHFYHSAEFRGDPAWQWNYWNTVLYSQPFGFNISSP